VTGQINTHDTTSIRDYLLNYDNVTVSESSNSCWRLGPQWFV